MVVIRKKHKETVSEKEARQQKEKEQAMGIQDQYQARGFELVTWVQDNKVLVSVVIASLVIGGALFSAYLYYQQRSAENASGIYLEAINSVEGVAKTGAENIAKWEKAKSTLMDLANHEGSGVADLAKLYAAHIALENNDAKTAVELYQSAVKSISTTDSLYPLAVIGLGYAQEKNNDLKGAAESFERLTELRDQPGNDLALFKSALLWTELKENERAKKNLGRLLEEYPASGYEKDAQRLKKRLDDTKG